MMHGRKMASVALLNWFTPTSHQLILVSLLIVIAKTPSEGFTVNVNSFNVP